MAFIKKMLVAGFMIVLAVAFAYGSLVMASLYLGYAALSCFAISAHAGMSAFGRLRPYRWSIPLLLAITTCYGYRHHVQQSIDPELASLMGSTTDCATLELSFIGGTQERLLKDAQNACYLNRIREQLKTYPPEEQVVGVFRTAEVLKRQKRLNPTTLSLLAAIDVLARNQQKQAATDKAALQLALMDDILKLVELYPRETGAAPADPDERMLWEIDRELEHKMMLTLLARVKKSFATAPEPPAPAAAPAAAPEREVAAAPAPPIQERLQQVQAQWKITDDELGK